MHFWSVANGNLPVTIVRRIGAVLLTTNWQFELSYKRLVEQQSLEVALNSWPQLKLSSETFSNRDMDQNVFKRRQCLVETDVCFANSFNISRERKYLWKTCWN